MSSIACCRDAEDENEFGVVENVAEAVDVTDHGAGQRLGPVGFAGQRFDGDAVDRVVGGPDRRGNGRVKELECGVALAVLGEAKGSKLTGGGPPEAVVSTEVGGVVLVDDGDVEGRIAELAHVEPPCDRSAQQG